MIGAEQKIKPDRPAPVRPADVMNAAVKNEQIEAMTALMSPPLDPPTRLTLPGNLQGLANRNAAQESARPAPPNLGGQFAMGATSVLAGLLGVATGNDGLAAAGTGGLNASLAGIQQALTAYDADIDGFEEGLRRMQELEVVNDARAAQEEMRHANNMALQDARVQGQMEVAEYTAQMRAKSDREHEEWLRGLPPTYQEKTNRMREETSRRRLNKEGIEDAKKFDPVEKVRTGIDKAQADVERLRDSLRVEGAIKENDKGVERAQARLEIAEEKLAELRLKEAVLTIIPDADVDKPKPRDAGRMMNAYLQGDIDKGLLLWFLYRGNDAGAIPDEALMTAMMRIASPFKSRGRTDFKTPESDEDRIRRGSGARQ